MRPRDRVTRDVSLWFNGITAVTLRPPGRMARASQREDRQAQGVRNRRAQCSAPAGCPRRTHKVLARFSHQRGLHDTAITPDRSAVPVPTRMRRQASAPTRDLLVATSAHVARRRRIGLDCRSGANGRSGSCKHESGHDRVDTGAAAPGVEQPRRSCSLPPPHAGRRASADDRLHPPDDVRPHWRRGRRRLAVRIVATMRKRVR